MKLEMEVAKMNEIHNLAVVTSGYCRICKAKHVWIGDAFRK